MIDSFVLSIVIADTGAELVEKVYGTSMLFKLNLSLIKSRLILKNNQQLLIDLRRQFDYNETIRISKNANLIA